MINLSLEYIRKKCARVPYGIFAHFIINKYVDARVMGGEKCVLTRILHMTKQSMAYFAGTFKFQQLSKCLYVIEKLFTLSVNAYLSTQK